MACGALANEAPSPTRPEALLPADVADSATAINMPRAALKRIRNRFLFTVEF
jgi:hypothetical protein